VGLFDHFWHSELVVGDGRGIAEGCLLTEARAQGDILPYDVKNGTGVGGRFDALYVDLIELFDVFQDLVYLLLVSLCFFLGEGDAGEVGDGTDVHETQ